MDLNISAPKRIPILYLLLASLIAVGIVPLYLYSEYLVSSNRERLQTNERLYQRQIAHALSDEVNQRQLNARNLMQNAASSIEVASGGDLDGNRVFEPQLRALIERFVSASDTIAYVTLLNGEGKGPSAGRIAGDAFLQRELEHAFTSAMQGRIFDGQPIAIGSGRNTKVYLVVGQPVRNGDRFIGVLATVIDLQYLVSSLPTENGLESFVVDRQGRVVVAAGLDAVTGQDLTANELVRTFVSLGGTDPVGPNMLFRDTASKTRTEMLGTYNTVPSLSWAVVVEKPTSLAFREADDMQRTARIIVVLFIIISFVFSYYFARRITEPIEVLTESTRAISRGEFGQTVQLKSRTEIGELANTFNSMSSDLERFVFDLRKAAEENRSLFMSSIQMLAGAVDEKDPYTRGHSDRVTRYSVQIATALACPDEEIERIRIAAQLHDVGKIGIEDRILKKPGALSPEEYEIMKTHTTKGATILRPVDQLREMLPGIELHHESLDGNGYPYALKGDAIPLLPRIIMVADTFDAMTTNRPYQAAMDAEYVVKIINSLVGKKFDPRVVAAFTSVFEQGGLRVRRAATFTPAENGAAAAAAAGAEDPGVILTDAERMERDRERI